MTSVALFVGWLVLIFLLWPGRLDWISTSPLVLGAILYLQIAGAQYSLAIIKPNLDRLFAAGTVAVAIIIGFGMRSKVLPSDSIEFAAAWIAACVVLWLTVGRRLHHQAMERVREFFNQKNGRSTATLPPPLSPVPGGSNLGLRSGTLQRRQEHGFLGEFEIVVDKEKQKGGMGEVITVRDPGGRIYAAKTFRIFGEAVSSLLGKADITDWAEFMRLLRTGDSPFITVIRQCLDAVSPDALSTTAVAGSLTDVSKTRLLEDLNTVIESDHLYKRVSATDLDEKMQELRVELENLPKDDPARQPKIRQFGRRLLEAVFGSTLRPSTLGRTGVQQRLVARFREEATIWLELGDHPHIVRAHRVFEADGRPFILLDYMGGGSLREHLGKRKGRPAATREELPDVVRFALQICSAMSFAADRIAQARDGARFVHGDLKPDNCLLDASGTLKITDLGLSRVLAEDLDEGDGSMTKTAGGTDDYMAPELSRGQGSNIRSDIYAFGATLLEMLTGQRPYPSEVDTSFLDEIAPDHESASALKTILMTCLAPEPEERYKDFAAVAADLRPLYEKLTGKPFTVSDRPTTKERTFLELANQGLSFLSLELFEDAVTYYDKALEVDPSDARAWNNRGDALRLMGKTDEALQSFETAIRCDPDLAGAWNNKGIVYEQRGALDEALACYREALNRHPDREETINTHNNIANIHGRRAQYQQAIELFDELLEVAPRYAEAWSNKGTALAHLDRFDEAIECVDCALDINPMLADAWYVKGTILCTQGKRTEALAALARVIELNPKDRQAKDDYEALRAAVGGGPTSSMAAEADRHWYRAQRLESLGRTDKALEEYLNATRCNPQFSEAWFNIGNIYMAKRDFAKAIESFDLAIGAFDASYPRNPYYLRRSARLLYTKAIAHQELGNMKQALAAYDEALQRFPQHAKALWNRGGVLLQLGRNREAADSMERGIDLDPSAAAGTPEDEARAYIRNLRTPTWPFYSSG